MLLFNLIILAISFTALFALVVEINRTDAQKNNVSRKIDVALFFCMLCIVFEKLSIIIDIQSEVITALSQLSQVASVFTVCVRVFYLQRKYPTSAIQQSQKDV